MRKPCEKCKGLPWYRKCKRCTIIADLKDKAALIALVTAAVLLLLGVMVVFIAGLDRLFGLDPGEDCQGYYDYYEDKCYEEPYDPR